MNPSVFVTRELTAHFEQTQSGGIHPYVNGLKCFNDHDDDEEEEAEEKECAVPASFKASRLFPCETVVR